MMFLKPFKPVWRPGQVPDLDLSLSFREVAELEAERSKGPAPDAFMTMFTRLIPDGIFDAEPLGPSSTAWRLRA